MFGRIKLLPAAADKRNASHGRNILVDGTVVSCMTGNNSYIDSYDIRSRNGLKIQYAWFMLARELRTTIWRKTSSSFFFRDDYFWIHLSVEQELAHTIVGQIFVFICTCDEAKVNGWTRNSHLQKALIWTDRATSVHKAPDVSCIAKSRASITYKL